MSPLLEIQVLARRELRRALRSSRGIALAALTLIGALGVAFACVWFEGAQRAGENAQTTEMYTELKRQAILHLTGDAAFAEYAAHIPTSMLAFLKVSVWLAPLLVALLGFDVVASDLEHHTIRFWTVRARRSSIFVAKLLGLWITVSLVTLAMTLLAGGVACSRGYVAPSALAGWVLRLWLVLFVISGAWCALATLVSAVFASPKVALLATLLAFFVSWLAGMGGFVARVQGIGSGLDPSMHWYEYFYPNAYEAMLLSPGAGKVLLAIGILFGAVVALSAGGSRLLARRDV